MYATNKVRCNFPKTLIIHTHYQKRSVAKCSWQAFVREYSPKSRCLNRQWNSSNSISENVNEKPPTRLDPLFSDRCNLFAWMVPGLLLLKLMRHRPLDSSASL